MIQLATAFDASASPILPLAELTERLCLPNGDWVTANTERLWLHREAIPGLTQLVEHLSEPGDPDRTRQLLAGILASALRQGRQDHVQEVPPSWRRHVWSLASSYQTTHATPPTMRRVAARFEASGRDELAAWCRHVADEESGHDALALRDLTALGLQAEAFVAEVRPSNSVRLVELFHAQAAGPEPVAVLGYVYVLERMALFTTAERVKAVEATLPPGVKATRCLRVHSAAGSDIRHVRESLEFIATLPAMDRRAIFQGAFETASLIAAPPDYPGDAAIDELITKFGTDTVALGA